MINIKRMLYIVILLILIFYICISLLFVKIPVNISLHDIESISAPVNMYGDESEFMAYYNHILLSKYRQIKCGDLSKDEITLIITLHSYNGDTEKFIRYGDRFICHYYNNCYENAYEIPKIRGFSEFIISIIK